MRLFLVAALSVASALRASAPEAPRDRVARRLVNDVVRRHEVVFTFDDGPHPDVTPAILDALDVRNVRAAFFACGIQLQKRRARAGSALLRRAHAAGHLVGTHTVHHPRLSVLDEKDVADEIDGAVDLVERATGERPVVFRPPFGDLPDVARDVLGKRDLRIWLWTTSVRDYRIADGAQIASEILADIDRRGGGVVLLHDTHPPSAEALPLILDGIEPLNERRALEGKPALRVVPPHSLL